MEKENRAIGEMLLRQMQELLYGTPPRRWRMRPVSTWKRRMTAR